MDCVYTSLRRRPEVTPTPAGEVAEVLGILWAHATPKDGLEHISGSLDSDRVDLLLYFLSPDPNSPTAHGPLHRAAALLARGHQRSPTLQRRYLPPAGAPDPQTGDPRRAKA
ncbi:hypothetical protein Snoj_13580 [Streptomyces nojiriensis]|uniref:Uncharacterized protein n=1 Tax=Streptomyces nojiriensis TaxID=66374 RepID=A0ABQ3SHT0_9ACTN|nr:hypothetical protein [Streptomyces nojiriensis]QTI49073.1 hypothetical protein JYK04_06943 [Streptomyces nojiriensis]GGS09236.1 hypothetical protein GCM10010205_43410 [Streptomyces nojiriensis]GHI67440.1 hypothetical protein Snoj_13580 [Streptomyces nojiriensis]